MGIDIDITKDIDINEWKGLLANSEEATIFHTYEWKKVMCETYSNYNQLFITARNGTGELVAGMPLVSLKEKNIQSIMSLPFNNHGGVVIRNDADKTLRKDILEVFCEFAKKCTRRYILNRLVIVDFFNKHEYLTSLGFKRRNVFTYILELNSSLEYILMNKVDKKTRSQVRQAIRLGVTIKEVDSVSESEIRILHDITKDTAERHGTTIKPETMKTIENILKIMGEKKLAKYLVAYHNDVPLAYVLQLMYKDFIFYAMGASYEKYWKLRPNNLLIWSIIENGVKNGCKYLNFGSVQPEQSGLKKFKEGWGATRVYYSVYEKKSLLLRTALLLKNNARILVSRLNLNVRRH
jgi:serine/alanine adding enzyme